MAATFILTKCQVQRRTLFNFDVTGMNAELSTNNCLYDYSNPGRKTELLFLVKRTRLPVQCPDFGNHSALLWEALFAGSGGGSWREQDTLRAGRRPSSVARMFQIWKNYLVFTTSQIKSSE
jgi:hypothetical protein